MPLECKRPQHQKVSMHSGASEWKDKAHSAQEPECINNLSLRDAVLGQQSYGGG